MDESEAEDAPASAAVPRYMERVRAGTLPGMAVGVLVGAAEVVRLAVDLRLPLGSAGFALVGLLALAVNACLGWAAAVVVGLVVHLEPPDPTAARRPTTLTTLTARQIAGSAVLVLGLYLWEGAARMASEGGSPASVGALAAMPFGLAAVVYFNARFWLRRRDSGLVPPVGIFRIAGGASLAVVVVSAALFAFRSPGGGAPKRSPSVVLVTVDGLRADHVSAPSTPAIDRIGATGVRFADAVTPTPETRAANASILVGLHPLRHHVLSDTDVLSRAYRSVFEVLEDAGWVTGGFVSSRTVGASSGLAQGFGTFDDDLGALLPGAEQIPVLGHVAALVRALRPDDGTRGHRSAADTVARFTDWLTARGDAPFAAWIHLDDPHVAALRGADPAAAVRRVDAAVGAIGAALDARGGDDPVAVVVAGTHGELLGAHGGDHNRTLYDEVVRVPLVMTLPGSVVDTPVVDAQVRLMDVAATMLDWLQVAPLDQSEGLSLTGYAAGVRRQTIWCALVGRDTHGGWLMGLRNNGVKYIRHPAGMEELYDLRTDPTEERDQAAEQQSVVLQARSLLASDAAALGALAP